MLVALGSHRFDITTRGIVLAVVDQTTAPTSDSFVRDARRLVEAGADALEISDGPAPGDGTVSAARVLLDRFDVPVAVRTSSTGVARTCVEEGVQLVAGSVVDDRELLALVAAAGGSLVLAPSVGGGEPDAVFDDLGERADAVVGLGIPDERVVVDAGIGRQRSRSGALVLLRGQDRLCGRGWSVLLDVDDAAFLPAGRDARRRAMHAAVAVGLIRGARIVRTRDVRSVRRVVHVVARLLEARTEAGHAREKV